MFFFSVGRKYVQSCLDPHTSFFGKMQIYAGADFGLQIYMVANIRRCRFSCADVLDCRFRGADCWKIKRHPCYDAVKAIVNLA